METNLKGFWNCAAVYVICCVGIYVDNVQAVRLQSCVDNAIELTENQAGQQTRCVAVPSGQTIQWGIGSSSSALVTCGPNQPCQPINPNLFTATRESTSSTLTFVSNATRESQGLGATSIWCRAGGQTAECNVDVYGPRDSEVSCSATVNQWVVSVSCNINKAYSFRGRYECLFKQGSNSLGQAAYWTGSLSGNFASGSCSTSVAMPTTNGAYTYTVIVTPGSRQVTASGTVTVAQPTQDPQITCTTQNGYIPENTSLACSCTVSDLGQPQGRLKVSRSGTSTVTGDYGKRMLQFGKNSASASDNGAVYRCVLEWGPASSSNRDSSYTLQVAYGPSTTILSSSAPVFELNPANPQTLTLTCAANDVNPSVTYRWSRGRGHCTQVTGNTCSFTPSREDNGDTITCFTANYILPSLVTSDSQTLTIHYPPLQAPVMSGYNGHILYDSQTTSLTCSVSGGNPPVSRVIIDCDGRREESSGTNGTINLTASRLLNDKLCVCSARWKNTSWYTQTANISVTVYYSPVKPTISHKQQHYPFLAGETPTMHCFFPEGHDPGNPAATLTFLGATSSPGQEVRGVLPRLTSENNNQILQCEARNAFTAHNGSSVVGTTRLEVYYIDTELQNSTGSDCVPTSDRCTVEEGQRVVVRCVSDSNPPTSSISWNQGAGHLLNFTADRSKPLNHSCQVETTGDSHDDRLPLRSNIILTVLTTYAAEMRAFTANQKADNVTVTKGQDVRLDCSAEGRPVPRMAILTRGQSLASLKQGPVNYLQQANLTHTIPDAGCLVSGTYTCEADNQQGASGDQRQVDVFVLCSPELEDSSEIPTEINYVAVPISISLSLIAYPPPHTQHLVYLGSLTNSTVSTAADPSLYTIHCERRDTSRPYLSTCLLTLGNVTESDIGFYMMSVNNGVGQSFTFTFDLRVNSTDVGVLPSSAFPIGGAVGGAIAAVAVVVVVVGAVFFVKRRRQTGKNCNKDELVSSRTEGSAGTEEPDMIVNSMYGTSGCLDGDDGVMVVNDMYASSGVVGGKAKPVPTPAPYEDVEMNAANENTGNSAANKAVGDSGDQLYSTVQKPKHSVQSPASTTGPSTSGVTKPDKPPKKSDKTPKGKGSDRKHRQKSLGKGKQKGKNDGAAVYGNVENLDAQQPETQGSVYENYGYQSEEGAVDGGHEADGNGVSKNADGLIYSTVAFTEQQLKKAREPAPVADKTDYADIHFITTEMASKK